MGYLLVIFGVYDKVFIWLFIKYFWGSVLGVVEKVGEYELQKKKDGVYFVTSRSQEIARIITPDYDPEDLLDGRMGLNVRKVRSPEKVKKEFKNIIEEKESRII